MPQTRQLAAIMFTDIVGYTALMGNNEQKAFDYLKKNRNLQKPIIEQFNGRWIKELGDGVMASFNTISDAVQAALKIQEACNRANEFQLRIGIHLGEVVFEQGDVFGDGVNIAARIQSAARPGSIYVSESVYQNISNKPGIETRFIDQELLKNVKEPVRIYEVLIKENPSPLLDTGIIPSINEGHLIKSIAVLPFVNMSSDPEQEYFSDGITEEILNMLAQLKDLKVVGRTSAFQFKGKKIDLRDVGEKLGVRSVLEGSVRKQGSRIRITAQLINVEDGFHLWSDRYDRNIDDLFAIQDEIALAITQKLKLTLLDKDLERLTKNPSQNTEAYELYLKGNYCLWQFNSDSFTKAIRYFEQAVKLDDQFSSAYAGLAMSYSGSAFLETMETQEAFSKAREWAIKAIEMDNSQAEAYNYLGYIETHDWNWQEAEKLFKHAIKLKPNYADAHLYYAWLLGSLNRIDEASAEMNLAQVLDPRSSVVLANGTFPYYWNRQFDKAVSQAKRAVEFDPASSINYWFLGVANTQAGYFVEAISAFKNAISFGGGMPFYKGWLGHALAAAGHHEEAMQVLDELKRITTPKKSFAYQISLIYLGLADLNQAMNYLELAFEERSTMLVYLKIEPYLDPLRPDPRFQSLLKKMNLD